MSKLVATEYLTLDGIFENPGGGDDSKYSGWSFPFWNDQASKFKYDELFAAGSMLYGRVTYDAFASFWPSFKDEAGFGDRMNSLPKYVVSTTLKNPTWNNTTVISENVPTEIAKLKAQPGQDILLAGSGVLVRSLMAHNLIDEYRLMVHPVIVGGGKRLFHDGMDKLNLKLTGTTQFSTGIIVLSYEPNSQA